MLLPTGDVVKVGDTVCVCVRRTGGKQMRWYAGRIIEFREDRAWIELDHHAGEFALLTPRSIRRRVVKTSN